jgi:toxin ParE1/3/4
VKVRITPPAKTDLFEIGAWIERDNPRRAITLVEELYQACLGLGTMPRAYPLVAKHEDSGVRRRRYKRYLIFYFILDGQVEVLRILHGARNYEAILFPAD